MTSQSTWLPPSVRTHNLMQITLFYGCYYPSPSVKRSSHTLVGRLTLLCNIPPRADAKLLLSAYFSFPFPFVSAASHSSLLPNLHALSRGAIHHLATRCPRMLPPTQAHLFNTDARLFTHLRLIMSPSVYNLSSSLKSLPATSSFSIAWHAQRVATCLS